MTNKTVIYWKAKKLRKNNTKKYKFLLCFLLFISFFGIIRNGYSQTAKTLLGTTTTNPTGTYTSMVKPTAGYTWFRGHIITDGSAGGSNQPTGYIEQSLNTSAPLSYHGTDTITFSRSGSLWTGSINSAIIGGYARLVIGNFGDATLLAINWFVTPETTVNTTINLTTTSTGSGTVKTIGTTSATLMEANTSRKYILIIDTGNQDLYVDFADPAATATARIFIPGGNGSYEKESISAIFTGALYCRTATGTTEVRVFEHN